MTVRSAATPLSSPPGGGQPTRQTHDAPQKTYDSSHRNSV